jgi:hypothetical protein
LKKFFPEEALNTNIKIYVKKPDYLQKARGKCHCPLPSGVPMGLQNAGFYT